MNERTTYTLNYMKEFVFMIGFGKERFEFRRAASVARDYFHSIILSGRVRILLIEILLYDRIRIETHEMT